MEPRPCCVENDFCQADDLTFELPLLNLYPGSPERPVINGKIDQKDDGIGDDLLGWNGTEYSLFIEIPMYIGGKNNDPSKRMGTAYLAYDCTHEILCGAAHLDQAYMDENPGVSVVESEDDSWIRIGGDASDPKLKQNSTDAFMYVGAPANRSFLIGYEGCWNTTGLTVMNNFVEVHFVTTEDDTVSSGKDVRKGATVCMEPLCPTLAPTSAPSKAPSLSPTNFRITIIQMDATMTWDITCPINDEITVANVIEKSLYDSINTQLEPGELQSIEVYEMCGETVSAFSSYTPNRSLQQVESDFKFKAVVESVCSGCGQDMFEKTDAAIEKIITDGSLTGSIHSNSGGVITAAISRTYSTSLDSISSTPSRSPPTPTTASKAAKKAKGQKNTRKN